MEPSKTVDDALEALTLLVRGFVERPGHPHASATSHVVYERPTDPESALTGETLKGPRQPMIVHDSEAVHAARRALQLAAIAAGTPLQSVYLSFEKKGDGWALDRRVLTVAEAEAFERDRAPLDEAVHAALRKIVSSGSREATAYLRSGKEPSVSVERGGSFVQEPLGDDLRRALAEQAHFFEERGRVYRLCSWSVKAGPPEDRQADLFYG